MDGGTKLDSPVFNQLPYYLLPPVPFHASRLPAPQRCSQRPPSDLICHQNLRACNYAPILQDTNNYKPDGDLRCEVGTFGSLFGAGEPWVFVALMYAISTICIIIGEFCFKQHDKYENGKHGTKVITDAPQAPDKSAPAP